METKQIKEIMELFEASGLSHMELEEGNLKIKMEKPVGPSQTGVQAQLTHGPIVEKPQEPQEAAKPSVTIDSPLVGTFYRAKSPEAKPYVKVGDHIQKGDVICMVEAMKTMNEIHSDQDGVVIDILVEDGTMVEYGQPLVALGADE